MSAHAANLEKLILINNGERNSENVMWRNVSLKMSAMAWRKRQSGSTSYLSANAIK
jgi:hypothetical protein